MPRKAEQKSNESPAETGTPVPVETDARLEAGEELLEQLRLAMERHAEWESKQVNFNQIQDQLLEKLDDLADLKNLSQIQLDAQEQIAGLQTALTLAYQKHFQMEADLEHLRVQLASELNAKKVLQQQLDESEQARLSLGRERNRMADERDEWKRQLEALRQAGPSTPVQEPAAASDSSEHSDSSELSASAVPASRARADTIIDGAATNQQTADESNSNTAGWEEQKKLLFSKYGLDGEGESDSTPTTESVAGPGMAVESEDPFDITRLNVSEIDTPSECVPAAADRNSVDTTPLEAAKPCLPSQHDDEQRKTEIELSLERARISRQRKELEEKIIAMQMSMSDSQNQKSDGKKTFLTRMTQFLKRDEQETGRESRIDNMMRIFEAVQDKQVARSQSQYRDPRDQPFAVPEGFAESLSPEEQAKTETAHDQAESEDADPGLAQPTPDAHPAADLEVNNEADCNAADAAPTVVDEALEPAKEPPAEESDSASKRSSEPEKPAAQSKSPKRKKRSRRK